MCYRPERTRRWCTVCNDVTSWVLDRSIGHSRCIRCHSDSRKAKQVKKNIMEEPKLNKQYVKQQIDAAIKELQIEYDGKLLSVLKRIDNIYQCPDCGAVAFRDSEHVCLSVRPTLHELTARPTKKICDYIMEVMPKSASMACAAKDIIDMSLAAGCMGKPGAIKAEISTMIKRKMINRRAEIIRVKTKSRSGKEFEKEVSGFVYWRGEV